MPLSDQMRIARERVKPRILELWFALTSLKSTVQFMQSGAHPDDETSEMLAALRYRDGLSISYACANRGEGGQNDIGTETTEDLGVLRTAEMERAADSLDMRLYWLSETPDDTIFDFGFSKSGRETLRKWGTDRTIHRFVEIVRTERPDILCPTFLDIPGQHGHHRAMTEMAHVVMDAAADSAFPGIDLPPWAISKLYLPAWSGAGGSYDDELPPPPATLTVTGSGVDPVSGWSYARIGQQSRAAHLTQGMGHWTPAGAERDFPLHLARSRLGSPESSVSDVLPVTLHDLAGDPDAPAAHLTEAGSRLEAAVEAFPDTGQVLTAAADALKHVRSARDAASDAWRRRHGHRLDRKERQLARVIRIAAGVDVHSRLESDWLRPGGRSAFSAEIRQGVADTVGVSLAMPEGWAEGDEGVGPDTGAPASDPYPSFHDPAHPRLPAVAIETTVGDVVSVSRVPLEVPPLVLPERSAGLSPESHLINTATESRSFEVSVSDKHPSDAKADLQVPEGWSVESADGTFGIAAPAGVSEGLHEIPLTLDGAPAFTSRKIVHPHTDPRLRTAPARVAVRVVHAALPGARIGYVGGGNDRVSEWLEAMGAAVVRLSDGDLADRSKLALFDSIVVGVFAMRFRPGLAPAMPVIHAWIADGGTLLTLYHRPWDNWDPATTPPRSLEIGQPSLRWRVTDETAEVTHLEPDHPLLNSPNRIAQADWEGWHKERGLYFAKAWDEAYVPLLEMADPDEAPHRGALLSAEIGAGRHTHCALILHHQMEKLTPGAFRLMANLVAPRTAG